MTQELVLAALDQAVARYRPPMGVLRHSDRRSQYAATTYQERLKCYQMTPSMSRKDNCWDNACLESWHSLLKKELVYLHHFRTRAAAEIAIFEVHRDLLQPAAAPRGPGVSDARGSEGRPCRVTLFQVSKFLTQVHLAAAGMIVFFRSLGWDIPTNLSLVCFDDIELAADIYPFLTVVAQPARQLGTVAAQLLLRRISDSTVDPPTTQCFDAEVTLRKSTLARIHTVRLQPETGTRARTPRPRSRGIA